MAFALVVGLRGLGLAGTGRSTAPWCLGQVGVGVVLGYVALCLVTHAVAQHQMARALGPQMAQVQRLAALPLPGGGPLQWRAIAETDTTYLVSRVSVFPGTVTAPQSIAKGPDSDNSVDPGCQSVPSGARVLGFCPLSGDRLRMSRRPRPSSGTPIYASVVMGVTAAGLTSPYISTRLARCGSSSFSTVFFIPIILSSKRRPVACSK